MHLGYLQNDTQDLQEFRPLGRNPWTEWEGNLFFCVYPFVPFEKIINFNLYIHALAPYYIHNTLSTYKYISLLSTFIKYRAVIPLIMRILVSWSRKIFINVKITSLVSPALMCLLSPIKCIEWSAKGGEMWRPSEGRSETEKGVVRTPASWCPTLNNCQ